jgi:hypothetical protein
MKVLESLKYTGDFLLIGVCKRSKTTVALILLMRCQATKDLPDILPVLQEVVLLSTELNQSFLRKGCTKIKLIHLLGQVNRKLSLIHI